MTNLYYNREILFDETLSADHVSRKNATWKLFSVFDKSRISIIIQRLRTDGIYCTLDVVDKNLV